MKNVSLYIAKRYNTHTLLISLVIISLVALLTGTVIYMAEAASELFTTMLSTGNEPLSLISRIVVYSLTLAYLLVQVLGIHLLFSKFLKTVSRKLKLGIAFAVALVCLGLAFLIPLIVKEANLLSSSLLLILTSSGLLALIIGLLSVLLSKRKITGVNIITSIAVFAITIATTALFIILSVFSGLEKMNLQFMDNVSPDLKISPREGKLLPDLEQTIQKLNSDDRIDAWAKTIEEKVSIEFDDKQDIAYIKGIDENYKKVIKIDTTIVYGDYFEFDTPYEILASDGVARRLQLYIDYQNPSRLRMPKPGTGLINTEEEAFNTAVANPIGVFFINDQFDKYIFSPIGLTQILLQLPENSAYSIEIKLKPQVQPNLIKTDLQKQLGDRVLVETREDIDATFRKVMNVENLIIYLIFTLVIIIASFNLAGAIIIIIIDKKNQIKTMWSFGMQLSQIKQIFFKTGYLITLFSILFGLSLGTIIGLLQNSFHLVMANPFVAFPFEFTVFNYIIVSLTVLVIGGIVSWLVSRRLPI